MRKSDAVKARAVRSSKFCLSLGSVLAVVLFTAHAFGTTTIVGLDDATVSGSENIGSSGAIIYGGIAGAVSLCASTPTNSTCDSCVADTTVTAGDLRLKPCNKRRIHPELLLHIQVSSDSVDTGTPTMTVVQGTQDQLVQFAGTPTATTKGNTGDIYVRWGDVCSKLFLTGTTTAASADCSLTNADEATAVVHVGINKDGTGTFAADEYTSLTIKLRNGISVDGNGSSLTSACSNSPTGICYFEVVSGDKKAQVINPQATNGFPNGNNTPFKYIRVLYEKRSDPSAAGATAFSAINPGSPYQDLEIGGAAPSLVLSPSRVQGLQNDQAYDFKLAAVDSAGNTGYYTPAALDQTCNNVSSINPASGQYECHTARPSEVVEILSKPVNCFVATAAYGSPMASEVNTFRAFRDRFLVPTWLGKKFVRFYYNYGPILARAIAGNEFRKTIARAALAAPLVFVKFALNNGGPAAIALLIVIFAVPVVGGVLVWRKRKRGARA